MLVFIVAGFVHNPEPFVVLVRFDDFVLIDDFADFVLMLITEGIVEKVDDKVELSPLEDPTVSCDDPGGSGFLMERNVRPVPVCCDVERNVRPVPDCCNVCPECRDLCWLDRDSCSFAVLGSFPRCVLDCDTFPDCVL
jgi:hypothetical protein